MLPQTQIYKTKTKGAIALTEIFVLLMEVNMLS